jgi:uncharacterized protein YjbJ (UPF0337 family)
MNKDQVSGTVKKAAGKAQRALGEVIDSPEQKAKGKARETEGKIQKKVGDAKEKAKEFSKKSHH